jgi:hypothetical protein
MRSKKKSDFYEKIDKIIFVIFTIFNIACIYNYFIFVVKYVAFVFCFGVCIYVPLFFIYGMPHFFRDMSSEYITEDLAEQRLEDDFVYHDKADSTIIEFWDF